MNAVREFMETLWGRLVVSFWAGVVSFIVTLGLLLASDGVFK